MTGTNDRIGTTVEAIRVDATSSVRVVQVSWSFEVQLWRDGEHVSNNGVFNFGPTSIERVAQFRNAHVQAVRWAKGLIFECQHPVGCEHYS